MTMYGYNNRVLRAVGLIRKRAAAVLTPEAEQAAIQPPADPSMMQGGQPPADPAAAQGALSASGPNGGQIPPEIMQDQQFLMWLQQQGVMFDPQSGMFYGPDGQPVPADMIMQAYDVYMQEMQGGAMQVMDPSAQQGGMDPSMMQGGQSPMDPAMMQAGQMPADPSMMQGGQSPMDPAMMQQPPADPAMQGMDPAMAQGGGQVPPEILQDDMFMQFLTEQFGLQFDPNTGSFMDPQSGQPVPPDMLMQAYQVFQQQMQQMPPDAMQPGAEPPPQGDAGQGILSDMMGELQKIVDDSVRQYTSEVGKKLETLIDKLDTVKQMLETIQGTDDTRAKADIEEARDIQDQLNAELSAPQAKSAAAPRPVNMFDIIARK